MTGPAALLAVAILLAATPAAATPVAIDRCVDVNREEVERLVDLEFAAFAAPEALLVTVGCDQRGVTLAVEDRPTRRRRVRSLALQHTDRAHHARLIALAAAELAAAVLADVPAPTGAAPPAPFARPAADPSPAPAPASAPAIGAPPSTATAPPAGTAQPRGSAALPPAAAAAPPASGVSQEAQQRDRMPRLRLLAEVGGARFFSRLATTAEVGLTLRHEGWRFLEPAVAVTGGLGRVTSKGREASAASLSITPLIGLHRRLGPVTARAASGPRLALGRLQASAALPGDQTMVFTAPWLAWQAQLGLATPVGPRFVVELVARGGYVLSPIGGRIAGDRAIAVEGPWIGAALSVGALL